MTAKFDNQAALLLLRQAYGALCSEFERLERLIQEPPDDIRTVGPGTAISECFNPARADIRNKLTTIGALLNVSDATSAGASLKQISDADPTDDDIRDAWQKFTEVRAWLLPAVASDLLAVIGGVYLRVQHLDDAGAGLTERKRNDPVSFSNLAHLLAEDLATRVGANVTRVLIVGDERPHVSGAVVRLRFPVCDVWGLALTAYEYGYVLAREQAGRASRAFNQKLVARLNAGESHHSHHKRELYLRRLFADAFATLFGGPSYVFALLVLRLSPAELSPPDVPTFGCRVRFALEILKRMNDKPKLTKKLLYQQRFIDVIGLAEALWSDARRVLGMEDTSALQLDCDAWIDDIYECFDDMESAIRKTYDAWEDAKNPQLRDALLGSHHGENDKVQQRPSMFTVLNAAWYLRCDTVKSGKEVNLDVLSSNALSLLDPADSSLITPAPIGAATPKPASKAHKEGPKSVPGARDRDERSSTSFVERARDGLDAGSPRRSSDP